MKLLMALALIFTLMTLGCGSEEGGNIRFNPKKSNINSTQKPRPQDQLSTLHTQLILNTVGLSVFSFENYFLGNLQNPKCITAVTSGSIIKQTISCTFKVDSYNYSINGEHTYNKKPLDNSNFTSEFENTTIIVSDSKNVIATITVSALAKFFSTKDSGQSFNLDSIISYQPSSESKPLVWDLKIDGKFSKTPRHTQFTELLVTQSKFISTPESDSNLILELAHTNVTSDRCSRPHGLFKMRSNGLNQVIISDNARVYSEQSKAQLPWLNCNKKPSLLKILAQFAYSNTPKK